MKKTSPRPRRSAPKPRRSPRSYTPLADAPAQPLVFADTELSEGIERHGLVSLLRAALGRQRRSDAQPLPNVLCALLVWPLLGVKSLHCFCAQLCQFLAGQVSVLYDFLGREDVNWRGCSSALARRIEQANELGLRSQRAFVVDDTSQPRQHPEAFYHGLRLCGIDGSRFTVTNAPPIKGRMRKARSRRGRAAFPQVGAAMLVELGLRNPLAAALGLRNESEMELSKELLGSVPEKSLLIIDRYYGVPELLLQLPEEGQRHCLVRVRKNLKPRYLERYADGSALVEIRCQRGKRLVREIVGRVQRGGRGPVTTVRLWTSLLDWRRHPAAELLGLYARRWEHETFYRELKVDMRATPYVQSHTPLTAAQEIAAMILAYAVLVDHRLAAAKLGEVGVLRISFIKTLHIVRGLW